MINSRFLPGIIYVLLATGTVFQDVHFGVLSSHYVLLIGLVVCVATIVNNADTPKLSHIQLMACAIFVVLFIIYLLRMVSGGNSELIFRRIDGGFISTLVIVAILTPLLAKQGLNKFLENYIVISLLILLITIIYKLNTNFWVRESRYFMNGPIVFGWMMGYALVLRTYLFNKNKIVLHLFQILAFGFGLIWSFSKGPVVACALCCVLLALSFWRRINGIWLVLIAVVTGSLVYSFDVLDLGRLTVIYEVATGSFDAESSFGSIGVRILMWKESIAMFLENPLFGVGVTNWAQYSRFPQLEYPHNIYLELLAETGLVGFTVLILLQITLFYCANFPIRLTMVFFFLCSFFSGDISYLRFHIGIPLAFMLSLNLVKK